MLQVYVPGVLACTAHVEKGDAVAVCVAMEQPGDEEGDWSVNMTRGTTLQGLPSGKYHNIIPFDLVSHILDLNSLTCAVVLL